MELVPLRKTVSLDDYASYAHLTRAVQELRAEAAALVPGLPGRSGMVNSAASGGVAAGLMAQVAPGWSGKPRIPWFGKI